MAQNLSIATSPLVDLLFPPMGIPSNIEGTAETANNTQAIKVPDQSGARTSDSQSADGSAKSFASQPASSDSSVAGAGNANQAGQHAQTNTSQPAVEPSKPVDSGAMPAQSLAAQSAPRESAAHAQADAPADATRPSGQSLPLQTGDDAATAAINTARLIQSMSQTEMRVGMHSAEFGEISIRTAVSQQQMTAQISVDSSDLGKAISAHIPAMQEKLGGETGLRALVEVSQGSMSFSGEQGSSSPRQQPSYAAPARIAATVAPVEADYPISQATTWAVSNGYRLDIRA